MIQSKSHPFFMYKYWIVLVHSGQRQRKIFRRYGYFEEIEAVLSLELLKEITKRPTRGQII